MDAALKNIAILVADDNETSALVTTLFLKRMGATFDVARDGNEAYQKVLGGSFDLILMDIQMPVVSGLAATKMIRSIEDEKVSHIPIIAFSADYELSRKQMTAMGINDVLSKPFDSQDLLKKIISNLPASKISSTILPATAEPVNLDTLQKLTAGNPEELRLLIRKSIEDFEEAKENFRQAFGFNQYDDIKRIAHKLKPQIHYLKAFHIQTALNEMFGRMENSLAHDLVHTQQQLIVALERAIDELWNRIAE